MAKESGYFEHSVIGISSLLGPTLDDTIPTTSNGSEHTASSQPVGPELTELNL